MNKKCLLVLAFIIMLPFSGYAQSNSEAQSESKGSFFFSGGVYNGIFSSGPVVPFSNFEIKRLTAAMIGGYYELTYGSGNLFYGLEAGYSSGSRFGGKGGVDFIPLDFTAAYVFPLANVFYIGPRLKIGAIGLLGPEWNRAILTAGARLDAELRFAGFPLGLFVAGGIDAFPTSPEFATLPVVEAGVRFPRGKFKKSGASDTKNKESAKTNTSNLKDDSSGKIAASPPPAPATPAPASAAPTTAPTAPATTFPTTPVTAAPVASPAPTATSVTPQRPTTVQGITGVALAQNRSIILEDGRQGILNSIYFEPDTSVLIESYRPVLDAVGRQLAADPNLKLLIRAYAANFGTAGGRYNVSISRARFSRDVLTTQYRVSANRLNIEAYGADKSPIYATSDWQSYRCVELILFRD